MSRPSKIIFYENTIFSDLTPGNEWLRSFDCNSHKVVDYLVDNGVGNTIYYSTINCLEKLRIYLQEWQLCYSYEESMKWYKNSGPFPKGYKTALLRLQDIYDFGIVQSVNSFPVNPELFKNLTGIWKDVLDEYLKTLDYKNYYLLKIRNIVSRFLYRTQIAGFRHPSELSYDYLEEYMKKDEYRSAVSNARYTNSIGDILTFMADKGLCNYGIGWFPYFRMHEKVLYMKDLTESQIWCIKSIKLNGFKCTCKEFSILIPAFIEQFKTFGYSRSYCSTAKFTLYNLLVFLEMHDLGYHPDVAVIWLEQKKPSYKNNVWKHNRRILDLFEQYTRENDIIPETFFYKKLLLSDKLPDWCRYELNDFLKQKRKEGWVAPTLCMYQSSVTRFCEFLVNEELQTFTAIDQKLIKNFNLTDKHLTVEGKNAYNVRIRKFLQFLERKQILPYGLHQALYCKAATREKIIVTLSEEDKDRISKKNEFATTQMELRNRAIVLLGLKMGLRSSDIVKIKLLDINWQRQTIRIIQKKTHHEIELPMPTEVGNAIYLYIKNARAKTEIQSVFVKTRAPFNTIKRGACLHALKSILPEHNCPGSGFHVTRKTFATDQLCNEIGRQTIIDMLGQRDTSSLSHYLNLDPDRMFMCPLSLSETGLIMKGERYD